MPAPFDSARLRTILLLLAVWVVSLASGVAEESPDVLTSAAQIRNLAFARASQGLPVRMRGVVVTEAGPYGNLAVIIADNTASIYVLGPTNSFLGVRRG